MPHSSSTPSVTSADRTEELLQRVISLEAEGTLQRHAQEFQNFPMADYMRVFHVIIDRVRWYLTYTGQLPSSKEQMTGDLLQIVRHECEVQTMWVLEKIYGETEDPFGPGENDPDDLPVEVLETAQESEIPVANAGELPYSPPTFGCWYIRVSHPLLWMVSLGAVTVFLLRVYLE